MRGIAQAVVIGCILSTPLTAQRADPTAYGRARDSASVRPVNRGQIAFVLPQKDLLAESIAHDPSSGAFFVGSTRHGSVTRWTRDGAVEFVPTGRDGMWMVIGIKVDPARRSLWVNSSGGGNYVNHQPEDAGKAGLFRFDLRNGRLLKAYRPTESGAHFFNDLVVADDGSVYLSDMAAGAIYRVAARSDSLELWRKSETLRGANGITIAPDQRTLYVAVNAGIAAVDMAGPSVAIVVAADSIRARGIDGLYWYADGLVGVQGGGQNRVQHFAIDASRNSVLRATVLEAHHPMMMNPTTGVIVRDDIYIVANSQFSSFAADGSIFPMDRLFETVILRIPLR